MTPQSQLGVEGGVAPARQADFSRAGCGYLVETDEIVMSGEAAER